MSCVSVVFKQRSWTWRTGSGRTFTSSPARWSCFFESFPSRCSLTATLIISLQPSVSWYTVSALNKSDQINLNERLDSIFISDWRWNVKCIFLTDKLFSFFVQEFLITAQNYLWFVVWSNHFLKQTMIPCKSCLSIYASTLQFVLFAWYSLRTHDRFKVSSLWESH